ncbi:MAG: hypothetical protein V4726_15110 [Verrucomicrobiota bacterium]
MNESTAANDFSTVRDFPDRLSPMVVKELRQGLRARYFAGTLIGFHALLWIIMVTDSQEMAGSGRMRAVWWLFAALMLVILPLRGLSVLTDERRANTMDMLVLTNLTAGRIVRGKWLAIAAQITLIAVSVIPYVLMMYFSRGLSLPGLLLVLFRVWLGGLLLTALFVSFSWNQSWITRAGLAMGSLWLIFSRHFSGMMDELFIGTAGHGERMLAATLPGISSLPGNAGQLWNSLPVAAAECLAMAALGFVFLEFGAGLLGPTENHSTPPRATALGLLGLALLSSGDSFYGGTLRAFAVWTLTAVTVFALTEKPAPLSLRPRGWRRWNPFSPGLPQGILFSCAAWFLALFFLAGKNFPGMEATVHRLAAWLFCGRLVMFLLPRRHRSGAGPLFLTGLAFLLIQSGLRLAGSLLNDPEPWNLAAGAVPSPVNLTDLNHFPLTLNLACAGILGCGLIALVNPLLPVRSNQSTPEPAAA